MSRIVSLGTADVRSPTSSSPDGSDPMNLDRDCSAACLRVCTDDGDELVGHGSVFTVGRGNDVQVAAIRTLEHHLLGRDVEQCWRTWARRGADSSTTRSCGGQAPTGAWWTWRPGPPSRRCETSRPSGRGCRRGSCRLA